jgi:hypothetical protein
MPENKKHRDPIPESFDTVDELDEFWSTHSTADYEDLFREVHFTIKLDEDELVPVRPNIARQLHKRARQRKISVGELVNQLLEEKLQEPI